MHGLDPVAVFGAQSSAAEVVTEMEDLLKPAEILQKETFKKAQEK